MERECLSTCNNVILRFLKFKHHLVYSVKLPLLAEQIVYIFYHKNSIVYFVNEGGGAENDLSRAGPVVGDNITGSVDIKISGGLYLEYLTFVVTS